MSLLTQVKIQFSTKFTYFLFPPQALQQHFFSISAPNKPPASAVWVSSEVKQ